MAVSQSGCEEWEEEVVCLQWEGGYYCQSTEMSPRGCNKMAEQCCRLRTFNARICACYDGLVLTIVLVHTYLPR